MASNDQNGFALVALAGRRIDANDAEEARFPLRNVDDVRKKISSKFFSLRIQVLVCSAACGTDLLALDEADKIGIPYYIVLPYDVALFKEKSVDDRPGNWSSTYDRIINSAYENGRILILQGPYRSDDEAYALATKTIIREAQILSKLHENSIVYGLIAWEGGLKKGIDATDDFRKQSEEAGFLGVEIGTL